MSNFKFDQKERVKLSELFDKYKSASFHGSIISGIEKLISDRDGWIEVERINKYGKHQHSRGVLGDTFISFDYWKK